MDAEPKEKCHKDEDATNGEACHRTSMQERVDQNITYQSVGVAVIKLPQPLLSRALDQYLGAANVMLAALFDSLELLTLWRRGSIDLFMSVENLAIRLEHGTAWPELPCVAGVSG